LRLPFRIATLEEWDTANYALGVEQLDLSRHQPHAPGYILLIWAARAVKPLVGQDPIRALSLLAALSGALTVPLLYTLMRTTFPIRIALATALLFSFSAQAMLQQVRPMADSFATFWLLAAALPLVHAALSGSAPAFVLGALLCGVATGSKQMYGLFLLGVILSALRTQIKLRRSRVVLLGGLAGLVGVLIWVVPLAISSGSLARYLALSGGQARFQEAEGLVFNALPARLDTFVDAVFKGLWLHPKLTIVAWGFVIIGALRTRLGPEQCHWLFWMTLPAFLVHVLLLGPTPRYAYAYLPFLCGLIAWGVDLALSGLGRVFPAHIGPIRSWGLALVVVAYGTIQVERAGPTFLALRAGELPIVQALDKILSLGPVAESLVIVHDDSYARHLDYYARHLGLRYLLDSQVREEDVEGKRRILILQWESQPKVEGPWRVNAVHLGFWQRDIPRWKYFSSQYVFWRVGLYELVGPYVAMRNWEAGTETHTGLWRSRGSSTILIYHLPEQQFRLHLEAAPEPRPDVRVYINHGREVVWSGATALALDITAAETQGRRVRIDFLPACPQIAPDDGPSSCLTLRQLQFERVDPPGAAAAAPGR
jgi:hypothetical protein